MRLTKAQKDMNLSKRIFLGYLKALDACDFPEESKVTQAYNMATKNYGMSFSDVCDVASDKNHAVKGFWIIRRVRNYWTILAHDGDVKAAMVGIIM